MILDFELSHLELTEHQKEMLRPPEDRLTQLIFPKAFKDRARVKRSWKRKDKWSKKFKGLFAGKNAKKWGKRLREGDQEQLLADAQGRAKVKPQAQPKKKAKKDEGKDKKDEGKDTDEAKDKERKARQNKWQATRRSKGTEPCKESPWHDKYVRVLAENHYEGHRGLVKSVSKYVKQQEDEPDKYRLTLQSTSGKTSHTILVDSDAVILEDEAWAAPKHFSFDYLRLSKDRKLEIANDVAVKNLEKVQKGVMHEIGTVLAALREIEERIGIPKDTVVIEPTVASAWARDGVPLSSPIDEEIQV